MSSRTREELRALHLEYGATLDDTPDGSLNLDLPLGRAWNANGSHTLHEPYMNSGGQRWRAQALRAILRDARLGVSRCAEPDCDRCAEEREAPTRCDDPRCARCAPPTPRK